jgi:hypothetical protein
MGQWPGPKGSSASTSSAVTWSVPWSGEDVGRLPFASAAPAVPPRRLRRLRQRRLVRLAPQSAPVDPARGLRASLRPRGSPAPSPQPSWPSPSLSRPRLSLHVRRAHGEPAPARRRVVGAGVEGLPLDARQEAHGRRHALVGGVPSPAFGAGPAEEGMPSLPQGVDLFWRGAWNGVAMWISSIAPRRAREATAWPVDRSGGASPG